MIIRFYRKLTSTKLKKKVTTFLNIFIATTPPLYYCKPVLSSEFSYA
jgi:hypothetical protein